MAKLISVTPAHIARMNHQIPGAVDMIGVFESMIQPIFPVPMMNLAIVITIAELEEPKIFEVRLNTPSQDLMSKCEFKSNIGPFGITKQIINLEKILLPERGVYTLDVFEKNGENFKFLGAAQLFIAEYPPKREITDELKESILNDITLIKRVKTEFVPVTSPEDTIKVKFSLEPEEEEEDEYILCPEDNKITVNGNEYDMTGLRRQCEWMYGQKIPEIKDKNQT